MVIQSDANGGDNKALIMVLGAARSGTTMLDLMLGNSDDVFSCGEVWSLFRPHCTHHFEPKCLCGDSECKEWKELAACRENAFHSAALRKPGIEFVADSSKDLRWLVDSNKWAQLSGTRVVNVVTWKDPISLAYSHWKRGRPVDYYRLAFIRYYGRFLDLGLPFVSVSYNKILADPAAALNELCEFIGMTYEPGREEFWRKRHHHLFGSVGTAMQVAHGESKLRVQSEYPQQFLEEYEKLRQRIGPNDKIDTLIARLADHELGAAPRGDMALSGKRLLKPAWYYYHSLKAIYQKWFPYEGPIAD